MKLTTLALLIVLAVPALGFLPGDEKEVSNLALRVYVNEVGVGRTLVTGYVDDISGLHFLKVSEYRYENNTIYSVTDSLIQRSENGWNLRLALGGDFDEYHTTTYIPASMELTKIDCSRGLDHQVSKSKESIIVDVQGFDVKNPEITIGYRRADAAFAKAKELGYLR